MSNLVAESSSLVRPGAAVRPPPTIESMLKPIFGLEGTGTIGVGASGIIVRGDATPSDAPPILRITLTDFQTHFVQNISRSYFVRGVMRTPRCSASSQISPSVYPEKSLYDDNKTLIHKYIVERRRVLQS